MHQSTAARPLPLPGMVHNEPVKAMSGTQHEDSGKMQIRDLRQGDWLWTNKTILFSPYIEASAFKVYCGLSSYAGNIDQRAWPSVQTLATKLNLSKSTVLRALKILEETGLISVERRAGTSSVYSLLDCKEVKAPSAKKKTQSEHHRFIDHFHKTSKHFRRFAPTFAPKDTAAVKRVLALGILDIEELEQLVIYFMADPVIKEKFGPSVAVFFSTGIFNGLVNRIKNSPTFYKDLDRYAVAYYGATSVPAIKEFSINSLEALKSELGSKMKVQSHDES